MDAIEKKPARFLPPQKCEEFLGNKFHRRLFEPLPAIVERIDRLVIEKKQKVHRSTEHPFRQDEEKRSAGQIEYRLLDYYFEWNLQRQILIQGFVLIPMEREKGKESWVKSEAAWSLFYLWCGIDSHLFHF